MCSWMSAPAPESSTIWISRITPNSYVESTPIREFPAIPFFMMVALHQQNRYHGAITHSILSFRTTFWNTSTTPERCSQKYTEF